MLESDSCYAVKILKRLGADVESMKEKTEQVLRAQKHRKELGYDDFDNEGAVDDEADEEDGDEASSWEAESDKEREKGAEKPGTQTKNYGFAEKKRSAAKKADGAREKLLQYGIDMTERAKKGRIDPVIGRKKEIEKVIQVLSRRTKNNPVLIGEPGVGKSAIAEGLSQLIIDENVRPVYQQKSARFVAKRAEKGEIGKVAVVIGRGDQEGVRTLDFFARLSPGRL